LSIIYNSLTMEKQELSNQDSIKIIMEMVQSTKHNIAQDKVIYLMWGYLVSISALTHYVLQFQMDIYQAYYVWLSMPVAGIITGVYYGRKKRKSTAKTFTDRAMSSIWIAFIVALIIFLLASPQIGWTVVYPVFMVLYGIGTATSGGIMKFKPLVIGGYLSMVIGLVAFYQPYDIQFFLLALAIIVSYVIPGHLLPNQQKA
jgi:hypothetical protein